MDSFEKQKEFFEAEWPALEPVLAAQGVGALIAAIRARENPVERRVLFAFARRGVVMGDWPGKTLDAVVEVAHAGIDELLAQAACAPSEDDRKKRIDGANVIAYNLAADLADCWPGDELPRETRHFEAGLAAAERCVAWREDLDKPAGPRSIALWAKGIHELSLGRAESATESFQLALNYGREASEEEPGRPIDSTCGFPTLVGAGYLGLARWSAGDDGGRELYDRAIGAFRTQTQNPDTKDDAEFGIGQLEKVRARYCDRTVVG